MKAIYLVTLCVLLYFAKDTNASILRAIFSPTEPPLQRVRTLSQARDLNSNAVLDFIGLVAQHSYPAEEHKVTTVDGYKLVLHRIPSSPRANNTKEKRVVYIQHGVIASTDTWVLYGPEKDLPFILADAGYDVWLGNLRGNTYCRSHVNLTASDRKFWDFSFHEHGVYDLPALIDYVLEYTGQPRLYFIGHSMGTTVSYTFLSMRPEYNKKMNLVVSLAPVAFWYRGVSQTLKILLDSVYPLKRLLDANKIYDAFPQSVFYATAGKTFCRDSSILQPICTAAIFSVAGNNPAQFNESSLPHIFSYYPCGSSTQNFYHYKQNYETGKFDAYDYGYAGNYERYNQKIPPVYDFSKITAPQAIFYAKNDGVVYYENAIEVGKRMPNLATLEAVPYDRFTHSDFIWATDLKTLLCERMLEVMENY